MPSPGKGGEKSTLPLPASEGQEKHSPSGTLGTPGISGNNATPSHREGEGVTLPVIYAHQDVHHVLRTPNIPNPTSAANYQVHPGTTGPEGGLTTHSNTTEFRPTKEVRPTRHESLPSGSTGLGRGGSELLPRSNIGGPRPSYLVDHGPRVKVRVLGPDPRRTHKAVSERPPAVIDSEKEVVILTGPSASKGTSSPQQRKPDNLQSNEVERRYKEPPSKTDYRQRSPPSRTTDHRHRYSPDRRAASPPRGRSSYRPPSLHDSQNRPDPRGLGHGDYYWRPGDHNGGPSDRESRPPHSAQSSSFRVDTVSRGIPPRSPPTRSPPHRDRSSRTSHRPPPYYSPSRESRSRRSRSPKRPRHVSRRSCSPTSSRHVSHRSCSPKRPRHVSRRSCSPKSSRHIPRRSRSPKSSRHVSRRSPRGGADPWKPSGGGSQEKNAPRRHGRRGSEGERVASNASDRSMGSQSRPKVPIQGDHASTSAPKTTRRGIEGSSRDGEIGEKPCASAGPDFGPTAETFGVIPSTLVPAPSPKGVLLKPTKSTSTPLGTNTSPSANTKCTSTVAPETMGSPKSFANEAPGGPVQLSGILPDSTPQRSTAPAKTASPPVALEIPKPPPHPNVSPEFDAAYLEDRYKSRKFLSISGEEFAAEMATRNAYLIANIARRKALEHPIHATQAAQPGGQNPPGDNSKTSESSRDANQMDTSPDDFPSLLNVSTHVDPDHATSPGPEEPISQTHEQKADLKGKGKKEAEFSDPDNDFSKENLWPGADSLYGLGSFTPFSPQWQSGSASFVAGAPEYHIPEGFFGSSPEPPIPARPTTLRITKRPKKPKPTYVDRATSPNKQIICATCGPPLMVRLDEDHAAIYNVHLKDDVELAPLQFTNIPKNYYLFHVLTFPPYRSRMVYSDKFMNLRDFTKVVRLGFELHYPISQITVYLHGRDSDGEPLNWHPIHIMSFTDWDGTMSVGREWSCQISIVVEFLEPGSGPAARADATAEARAAARRGPRSGAGPSTAQ